MSEFPKIFKRLRENFKKHEDKLNVKTDEDGSYYIDGPYSERFKRDLNFGGVEIKKNYVSYHLMPVYMYKDLVAEIPKNLTKRMQGKSCFNFDKYDAPLFDELEQFTDRCYKVFQERGENI